MMQNKTASEEQAKQYQTTTPGKDVKEITDWVSADSTKRAAIVLLAHDSDIDIDGVNLAMPIYAAGNATYLAAVLLEAFKNHSELADLCRACLAAMDDPIKASFIHIAATGTEKEKKAMAAFIDTMTEENDTPND